MIYNIGKYVVIVAATALVVVALVFMVKGLLWPQPEATNTPAKAVEVGKAASLPRAMVQPAAGKGVEVIDRQKAVEKFGTQIPKEAKQITAIVKVPPNPNRTDTQVVGSFDPDTGKTDIYYQYMPPPVFELLLNGRIGGRYLYAYYQPSGRNTTELVAFGQIDLFRTWPEGKLYWSLYGEAGYPIQGQGDMFYKFGVELSYRTDSIIKSLGLKD